MEDLGGRLMRSMCVSGFAVSSPAKPTAVAIERRSREDEQILAVDSDTPCIWWLWSLR